MREVRFPALQLAARLACTLLLGLLATGAQAQVAKWIKLPPPANVGAHVYDSLRNRGERFFGEVRISVPVCSGLALDGLRPNPVSGPLLVSFSLPNASLAILDLLDVTGRRLLEREVGSLGAGAHTTRLDAAGTPPATGLYLLRLRQGREVRTTRAVVAR